MTKKETVVIMGILKASYPYYYKDLSKEEAFNAINVWYEMLQDYPLEVVKLAIKRLIVTKKDFPPSIGDVIEQINKVTATEEDITEEEAWQKVRSCINYYQSKEKFETLPPILKKLVGSPSQLRDWAIMDKEHVETVVKSNFVRSYRAKAKVEKENAGLPKSIQANIIQLSERLKMKELGSGEQ